MESHPSKERRGSPEPRPVCREVTVSKRKIVANEQGMEEQINVRQGLRTTADEVRDRIAKLGITESDVEEAVAEVRREAASEIDNLRGTVGGKYVKIPAPSTSLRAALSLQKPEDKDGARTFLRERRI